MVRVSITLLLKTVKQWRTKERNVSCPAIPSLFTGLQSSSIEPTATTNILSKTMLGIFVIMICSEYWKQQTLPYLKDTSLITATTLFKLKFNRLYLCLITIHSKSIGLSDSKKPSHMFRLFNTLFFCFTFFIQAKQQLNHNLMLCYNRFHFRYMLFNGSNMGIVDVINCMGFSCCTVTGSKISFCVSCDMACLILRTQYSASTKQEALLASPFLYTSYF